MPKRVSQAKKSKPRRKPGPQQMPPKWLTVIDLMAIGGLSFQAAMEQTGYSKAYINTHGYKIKRDARFCGELQKRTANIKSKSEDLRDKRTRDLNLIIDDADIHVRDRIAAIQLQGRMNGWLSETIRHETTERQSLLDEAGRQEAARLASLALDTRSLPDVSPARKAVTSLVTQSSVPVGSHTANEYVTGDTGSDTGAQSDIKDDLKDEGDTKDVRQD